MERGAAAEAQRLVGSGLQEQLKATEAKLEELKRTDRSIISEVGAVALQWLLGAGEGTQHGRPTVYSSIVTATGLQPFSPTHSRRTQVPTADISISPSPFACLFEIGAAWLLLMPPSVCAIVFFLF